MIYIFTGAGNTFAVTDGRGEDVSQYREASRIRALCREHSTDGLMILLDAVSGSGYDFQMEFYNPDGSGGMMCGNGGRCIVAFASMLGIEPASVSGEYRFLAPDGPHDARILSHGSENLWTVRLGMKDVSGIRKMDGGYFLNTGTRHFVTFVEDVDSVDVQNEGRRLRLDPRFRPEGTNVNFVQITPGELLVRTFEKGVEGETLACGTGLTASALVHAYLSHEGEDDASRILLRCRRGDILSVEYEKGTGDNFKNVYLTGPAELISIII